MLILMAPKLLLSLQVLRSGDLVIGSLSLFKIH